MKCGKECPFFWHDGFYSEDSCSIDENPKDPLRRLVFLFPKDEGCWLPAWCLKLVSRAIELRSRVGFMLGRLFREGH